MHRRTFLSLSAVTAGATVLGLSQSAAHAVPPSDWPKLLVMKPPSTPYHTAFSSTVSLIAADQRAAAWYEQYRIEADGLLDEPAIAPGLSEGLNLTAAREILRRTYVLGLVHHVWNHGLTPDERHTTERRKYFNRAWLELREAAVLPSWHPEHFLDTAELAHAFAVGYDWFYRELDAGKEVTLRNAIVTKALVPGRDAYDQNAWWTVSDTNWNLVCNGGLLLAALAVRGNASDSELAERVMSEAMSHLTNGASVFSRGGVGGMAVGGSYPEGPGYWIYGTSYLALAMAAVRTSTGESESITHADGVDEAGLFGIYTTSPSEHAFNYGDGNTKAALTPEYLWLARRFVSNVRLPDERLAGIYTWAGGRAMEAVGADRSTQLPTGLLWHVPERELDPIAANLARDAYFPGYQPPRLLPGQTGRYPFHATEVVTMRSAWLERRATYLAAKGGFNGNSHGDLDLGTFVFDALGQRWVYDYGAENYSLPGYTHHPAGQMSQRWHYYRKRAEAHNTVVVNPGKAANKTILGEADQLFEGHGSIVDHHFGDDEAWAIADLSAAHPDLSSWRRGWRLFDQRRQLLVQDEIICTSSSELYSFMQTLKPVVAAADGRSVTMTVPSSGGEPVPDKVVVRLLEPATATLQILDATPLPSSPNPPGIHPNPGWHRISVHLTGVSSARIVVQLSPLADDATPLPAVAQVQPLTAWSTT